MTSYHRIQAVLTDPAASYWLKGAVRELQNRDIIDAVNDIKALDDIFTTLLQEIQGR